VIVPTYREICTLQRNGLPEFATAQRNAIKLDSPFISHKHNLVREEVCVCLSMICVPHSRST
jgi:hypothetical protein